jgi:hypothetical protein
MGMRLISSRATLMSELVRMQYGETGGYRSQSEKFDKVEIIGSKSSKIRIIYGHITVGIRRHFQSNQI